jgi:hypothetical protein
MRHSLVVLPQCGAEQQVIPQEYMIAYDIAMNFIKKGYVVIYGLEDNASQTVKRMAASELIPQAKNLISSGNMVLIKRNSAVELKSKSSMQEIKKTWESIVFGKSRKVVTLCAASPLIMSKRYEQLVVFERIIQTEERKRSGEAICFYTLDVLMALPLSRVIEIIRLHDFTLHRGLVYSVWTSRMILDIIKQSLDSTLGDSGAFVTLKSLKLIYKIDDNDILVNPHLFEGTIRRMFGKAAEDFLETIKKDLLQRTLFLQLTKSDDSESLTRHS